MTRTLVFFPEGAIALQNEIYLNHPDLLKLLSKYPHRDLETKMATVAAYCNVAVDGYFREKDLEGLFHLLLKKLQERSTLIVQSSH